MKLTRELAIEVQRQKNLAAKQRRESLFFYSSAGALFVGYFIYRMGSLETEREFFYLLGMLLLARFLLPLVIAASFAIRPSGLAACPVCQKQWGLESVWSEPVASMSACGKCETKVDDASLQKAIETSDDSP